MNFSPPTVAMEASMQTVISAIHASPTRAVVYLAGGASQVWINRLFLQRQENVFHSALSSDLAFFLMLHLYRVFWFLFCFNPLSFVDLWLFWRSFQVVTLQKEIWHCHSISLFFCVPYFTFHLLFSGRLLASNLLLLLTDFSSLISYSSMIAFWFTL